MKIATLSATLFTGLLAASMANAADNYTCTQGGVERSIKIIYQTPGQAVPCEVQYTKDGISKSLWAAQNSAGYCEEQAQAFADKLSGMGWACTQDAATTDDVAPTEEDMTPAEGADGN